MGAGFAAVKGIQDIPTAGFGDEIGAAFQAGLMAAVNRLPESFGKAIVGDGFRKGAIDPSATYQQARDLNRQESREAASQQPGAYYGAGTALAVPMALATPSIQAAKGAGLLARTGIGALNAGIQGTVAGVGMSESETMGGIASDALGTGMLTAPIGAAFPLAGAAASRLVNGVVKPTPAAQRLMSEGVDLTVGQMDPASLIGQVEQANTSGAAGKLIQAQRQVGREGWQNAVLNKVRPPGAGGALSGDIHARLSGVADEFSDAYGSLKGHRVMPEIYEGGGKWRGLVTDESLVGAAKTKGLFDLATDNPNIISDESNRQLVRNWLANKLTQLPKGAGKNGMPADRLQALRSDIRTEARGLLRGNPTSQDRAQAQMLLDAEEGVTRVLEEQLPEHVTDTLRAADSRYGMFKTVESAVAKMKDKPDLAPSHLSNAISEATNKSAYARGAGGELRELARAGHEALDMTVPPTGVRTFLVPASNVPLVREATGFASYLANQPSAKRFLTGQTAPQRAIQAMDSRAPSLQALKSAIQSSPALLGRYGPVLHDAMMKGERELATTNYVLSQRDPEYRRMTEELSSLP